jgi:flagellar biosynthesis GTPase FlhF
VAHDDFETVHPDELIAHLSQAPILKIGVISLGLHVAMIVLLSIGNFAMCAKYKTFSVTGAVAEHAAALQDQKAAAKKAERSKTLAEQKAKRDAQAKIDAEKEPKKDADAAEKPAREKSAIEKELEETSSERPTESSMTLDDMDDGL